MMGKLSIFGPMLQGQMALAYMFVKSMLVLPQENNPPKGSGFISRYACN